jgi:microcin C transport system substrate-binding protein
MFQDRRVRQAISVLFDFEWINASLFHNAYKRNASYFPNSQYAHQGAPSEQELALLKPYKQQLPKDLFEGGFTPAVSKGDGNVRQQMRTAIKLLREAGWEQENGVLTNKDSGEKFEFEFIYRQAGLERVIMPFVKNLERVGIIAKPRLVESAQYKTRLDHFDFDMMTFVLSQGTAPSYEQRDYFHSSLVDVEGSQNYPGIKNPIVDALIEKLLKSQSEKELITTMRALDRVLMFEHYIVPNWHIGIHRVAYWNRFSRALPSLSYKLGAENWWIKPHSP